MDAVRAMGGSRNRQEAVSGQGMRKPEGSEKGRYIGLTHPRGLVCDVVNGPCTQNTCVRQGIPLASTAKELGTSMVLQN